MKYNGEIIEGIGSGIAIVSGAILFMIGYTMRIVITTLGNPLNLIAVFSIYIMGFILVFAGVSGLNMKKWGKRLSSLTVIILFFIVIIIFFNEANRNYFGTDGILFTRYSIDLLVQGKNPYSHSMLSAFDVYPIDRRFVTYRINGEIVTSLSYPSLSFLFFLPQVLLGIPNLNLTPIAVLFMVLIFLVYESPGIFSLVPILIIFADPNLTLFTYGGVFDILWVLPLLIAMRFWVTDKYIESSLFLGLAFAVKQTPWFIAPFLLVWLYLESDSYYSFKSKIKKCVVGVVLGFFIPNIPFIIWNPAAWMESVFTPVFSGFSLVKQGSGLTLLSVSGVFPLPKIFFTMILLGILSILLMIYILYFDRLKWTAWIMPALILWVNYRSLQNYFIFFIPIAYYSILLRYKLESNTIQKFND